jgi:hypothetical protein
MMGWLKKKAPSPAGFAVDLSPQGEVKAGFGSRSDTSPFGGEVGRTPGKGAFNQTSCAIWNDIQRALEPK